MKKIFKPGDTKLHRVLVKESDVAAFGGEEVHPVCATFVLAREIEWASRLFVLEIKEADEEGIGTSLEIKHISAAFPGEELLVEARLEQLVENKLLCSVRVQVGERLVALGTTGQKIMKKVKLDKIFENIRKG